MISSSNISGLLISLLIWRTLIQPGLTQGFPLAVRDELARNIHAITGSETNSGA